MISEILINTIIQASTAGTLLSARMKHSCISMTFKHYFIIGKQINAEKYKDKLIFEVINFTSQMKVFEYC